MGRIEELTKLYIPKDQRLSITWSILPVKGVENIVSLRGEITVNIKDRHFVLSCKSRAENDDQNIGNALQAINEDFLDILRTYPEWVLLTKQE